MKKYKILYNITGRGFHRHSLGRKISEVIGSWKNDKYNVDVVCGGDIDSDYLDNKISSYGSMDFHQQSFRRNKFLVPFINSYSELKDIFHDKKLLQYLNNNFKNKKIDLVWERNSRLHRSGYLFAKENGIPFVFEWMDNLMQYKFSLFRPYALWIEKFKEKNADYIVVVSEVLKNELIKKGIDKDKIKVVYNGVNPNEFKPSKSFRESYRSSIGISNEVIVVGYLGSFAFYHDTERLIYAAQIVKEQGIENIKFLLVGSGKEYQKCYDLAKNLGLIDNTVIFKDGVPKEKVPEVLAAIDISVLPGSTDIICPIKVFEYMAVQTVSLVPDYACNREVISNNSNGVLFTPHDEKNLASKIMDLVQNKEFMESIGKNARKTVMEKYTWDKTWERLMDEIIVLTEKKNDK
jgi:glycosyltransferase involved in cell wall biosynthesis